MALALGPWFIRMADSGPVSAGFWRQLLALPFLVLLARSNGQPLVGLGSRTMAALALAGVFFGLDIASWHVGIELTRLANATLFGNAGSLVLMVAGFVMLRRLPLTREWLAIGAAIGGAAILFGQSLEISASNLVGDVLCVIAGLFYGGYLIILQDQRGTLGSWSVLAWSVAAGLPVLLIVALIRGEPFWPQVWWPLIGVALSSQVLGQGLLVYSLRHFRPLVIGLALLTQPALSALVGFLAFGETLGGVDLLGMGLLASALVIARVEARPARPAEPAGQG